MLNMNAVRAYQQAEQEFLVDGSDPYRLVQILFTELLASMDRTALSLEAGDLAGKSAASSKALTIVYVLSTSLDFERGGDVALNLGRVYDYCQRRMLHGHLRRDAEAVREARKLLGELREAWVAIR